MENNLGSIINDNNLNKNNQNQKVNVIKSEFIRKIINKSVSRKNPMVINFILFEIISILLPKLIFSKNFMEIKVNQIGYNQIISDDYNDTLPFKVFVNNVPKLLRNKKVYVESINDIIYLEWPIITTEINVTYMFSNLTTIISVKMNISGLNGNMSYMFYNCNNLEQFTYGINYDISYGIQDMRSMFYNCYSLKSFDFTNLYLDFYKENTSDITTTTTNNKGKTSKITETIHNYYYYDVSFANMFHNCKSLVSIDFGSNNIGKIIDMRGMFYNCFSLKSINLIKILPGNNVNLSYMFYNCSRLKNFDINNINIIDMKYIFYNCTLLNNINIESFSCISSYINMSNVFYNCYSLSSIQGDFSNLNINDAREMFYNCSFSTLNFNPNKVYNNINMTKMFYNCTKLQNIIFNNENIPISPNDLSYAFYNCISLTNLSFNNFKTDKLQEISYMMFNCKRLIYFSLENSNFSNLLTKNMRGVFQNCKRITSLNLTLFSTPNVEIMWDMFKGCSSLRSLAQKFDTSNVVDMESMFEGCKSLTSLNLDNFKTPKVHYMNKMFCNCQKLQTLNIRLLTSNELGTMHQMFYNCQNLTYLDIYSLNENDQSIFEMFEGASTDFQFCVENDEKIPKLFKKITSLSGTSRDCSAKCYGKTKERVSILGQKLCCANYEYNGHCFDVCPSRTKPASATNKSCVDFTCEKDEYYNYNQSDCIEKVPVGYYENDTKLRTIDKCPENCTSCEKKPTQKRVYCLTCKKINNKLLFLFFGNCISSCSHGYYNKSGVLTCNCVTTECSSCTEESLEKGLCSSCASGYYPKSGEYNGIYKKCYKEPPKYYFSGKEFLPCYSSCQNCFGKGNKTHHNCISCDSDNAFVIKKTINKNITKNCYKKCDYHYYFDNKNDYQCSQTKECPLSYKFLIVELGECVKTCPSDYKMKLRNECYKECPKGISKQKDKTQCAIICPVDAPFELVEEQSCVDSCTIMERNEKLCITNNIGNMTNLQIQKIIHDDIISDLVNKFNYSIISDNYSLLIEEKNTTYEIITTKNQNKNNKTSNINFGRCESILKEYYAIPDNEPLYILKMDAYIEGKMGPIVVYEVFYPLDSKNLVQLDISICEGETIGISYYLELENPELYDKNNPIYNDICHPYTSVDGVDMTLSEKQKDYENNNKSLCEENCEYIGYDKLDKLVKCNCDVKDNSALISEIKIDKNKLYDFMSLNKIANFDVLKCLNLIIKIENLLINIGFYSFMPTFICYFLAIIIFCKKDWKFVKNKINTYVIVKKNLEYLKERRRILEELLKKIKYRKPAFLSIMKKKHINKSKFYTSNFNIYNDINNKIINHAKIKTIKSNQHGTIEEKITEEDISQINSSDRLNRLNNIASDKNIYNDIIIINKRPKNAPPLKTQVIKHKKFGKNNIKIYPKKKENNCMTEVKDLKDVYSNIKSVEEIAKEEAKMRTFLRKNDKELNELNFKLAIKFDNRTFWKFYFSLLKADHLLFKIINSNDYNSRTIKIYLFLYNFGLSFAVNGLFFDDEAIDQIFEEKGKFNFLDQIPQIIYSSIITFGLSVILDYLALPEDTILEIKRERVAKNAEKKATDIFKILPIKFIFFFILSFLFMIACWYYISCFCAVYRNTQYYLLKDTLISFSISMLTPVGTKLIPGIFRFFAIKKRSQIFFRISLFTQMLL